jgi:N-acetyl sugar amidotransferase
MGFIEYPNPIDLNDFKRNVSTPKILYGLPSEVKYCRQCVISNQRPNSTVEYQHSISSKKQTINFDSDGICDACRFSNRKNQEIDWGEREQRLKELCDKFRKSDGSYDCLVPGSGGKDSFFASHVLKEKYGMHPLTVTWAPHIYTEWGWRNFQSWIHAGHDNYLMTPNGRVHRLLTRLSTELLFHPFQAFMFGQKTLAPKMALLFDIPLVFYGENEAEYGNPLEDTETSFRDESYFASDGNSEILLGGVSTEELIQDFGIHKNDLKPYMPANSQQIYEKGVQVHYLGYYLKWHPQSCYYYAVEHGGFEASPERTPGTYSKYNSIDDRIDDFHYYTTGIKFGIGRATYDAAQEIRSGDIDRSEGIALVKRFDHEFPERFANEIFKYLTLDRKEFPIASRNFESPTMDRQYFDLLTDNFRSPHLWMFDQNVWKLRHPIDNQSKVDTANG